MPYDFKAPWSLESANEFGIEVIDSGGYHVLSRYFSDDDRKHFRKFMQEDLERIQALIELVNSTRGKNG